MAYNNGIITSEPSVVLGIHIPNQAEAVVIRDGPLKFESFIASMHSALWSIRDQLNALLSVVQQAEISGFDLDPGFLEQFVESANQISKRLDYLGQQVSTLQQRVDQLNFSKYLFGVQKLSPRFIAEWKFMVDDAVINYSIKSSNKGYADTFLRAQEWLLAPERQAFRDLDVLLNKKEQFLMFKKITYYGLVGALYDESPVDLPDGTFECPIRLGSSPKHNVLVVLDVTTQNLVPEPETEFFCGVIWPTLPNSMDILRQFETNIHRQFDGFRTLLSRLVSLEKQITLQICHYLPRASIEALQQSMRVLLVSPHVPSMGVVNKLLNCQQGRVLFPNLSALHCYQNFKVQQCNIRRDSI